MSKDVPKPVDDEHYGKKRGEKRADARGVAVVEKSAFGLELVWDFSFLTDLVTLALVA